MKCHKMSFRRLKSLKNRLKYKQQQQHLDILYVGCLVALTSLHVIEAAPPYHKHHHHRSTAGLHSPNTLSNHNMDTVALVGVVDLNSASDNMDIDLREDDGGDGGGAFEAASAIMMSGGGGGGKINTDCPVTTSSHCLRCNSGGCIKCPMYLVTDTRQCAQECPSGYIDQWSAHTEFMGRVCVPTPTGYSGPVMAAFAGLLGGFLVCLSLLAVAVMLVRRKRRRKTIKQKLINEHTLDRSDFMRQLNDLRPNAEYFLAMLNDTRRQIRKLYLSGEVAAANSYRPIVRDLAKILILLNRPIELIPTAPHDWNRLYAWSEQALQRYKPQVGQLIDFFQSSSPAGNAAGQGDDFEATTATYATKKHSIFRQQLPTSLGGANGSAAQKLHLFGSLISLHEFEEPRPSDPFGSSFNTLKNGNLISDLNASSLWLEDEFYKLGFRPQDEITTEL